MKALLVFLAMTGSVEAAEFRLHNGITVSDAVPVALLPEFTRGMSAHEYFAWASEQNRQTLAALKTMPDHVRYKNVSEYQTSTQTRYGGGVGYGGFGGSGGYDGYLGTSEQQGGGGFNIRFGANRLGNAKTTTRSGSSASYQMEFHSWPVEQHVMLLNPYCRPRG